MPKSEETKIVPALPSKTPEVKASSPNYMPWLIALVLTYFVLMLLISFLPMTGYIKVLSLVLGAFLLFDCHHSIKLYVKTK